MIKTKNIIEFFQHFLNIFLICKKKCKIISLGNKTIIFYHNNKNKYIYCVKVLKKKPL